MRENITELLEMGGDVIDFEGEIRRNGVKNIKSFFKKNESIHLQALAELCKNHLQAMEDVLADADTYGALLGLIHGLKQHIASITEEYS